MSEQKFWNLKKYAHDVTKWKYLKLLKLRAKVHVHAQDKHNAKCTKYR